MAEIILLAQRSTQKINDGAGRRSKPVGRKAAIEPRRGRLTCLDLWEIGSLKDGCGT
ncbi:hypothetical protein [Sinorhizobium glycinis]|uniref:hypothetical protein n=1 Tax=Sinorhizobium glycinis TaxID=1472378 RepID=UPI001FCD933B|nr:hypothetical protein [Sinorhizobium glycinis]